MKKLPSASVATIMLASIFTTATPTVAQEPFIGEVRLFGFNFCPRGWTPAAGQIIAINSNTSLFSLYGTIYGGDGRTSFGLPDLRGRAPVHNGTGAGLPTYRIGQRSGNYRTQLSIANMPSHSHTLLATSEQPSTNDPKGATFGTFPLPANIYASSTASLNEKFRDASIANTGGSQPAITQSPILAMTWCVALQGTYPSRS